MYKVEYGDLHSHHQAEYGFFQSITSKSFIWYLKCIYVESFLSLWLVNQKIMKWLWRAAALRSVSVLCVSDKSRADGREASHPLWVAWCLPGVAGRAGWFISLHRAQGFGERWQQQELHWLLKAAFVFTNIYSFQGSETTSFLRVLQGDGKGCTY